MMINKGRTNKRNTVTTEIKHKQHRRVKRVTPITRPFSVESLSFEVAGVKYYNAKQYFRKLKIGARCRLVFEPDNEFDKNAIIIFASTGEKLGYVPRKLNLCVGNYIKKRDTQAIISRFCVAASTNNLEITIGIDLIIGTPLKSQLEEECCDYSFNERPELAKFELRLESCPKDNNSVELIPYIYINGKLLCEYPVDMGVLRDSLDNCGRLPLFCCACGEITCGGSCVDIICTKDYWILKNAYNVLDQRQQVESFTYHFTRKEVIAAVCGALSAATADEGKAYSFLPPSISIHEAKMLKYHSLSAVRTTWQQFLNKRLQSLRISALHCKREGSGYKAVENEIDYWLTRGAQEFENNAADEAAEDAFAAFIKSRKKEKLKARINARLVSPSQESIQDESAESHQSLPEITKGETE